MHRCPLRKIQVRRRGQGVSLAVLILTAGAWGCAPNDRQLASADGSLDAWSGDQTTSRVAADLPVSDRQLIQALREFVPHVLRLNGTPGLNVAVGRRGTVIYEEGFGFADLAGGVRMSPDITTHSGSMGKTYTATAAMQLVELGVLDLDAPLNRYLADFQIQNPLGGPEVTLRHLLTHRSGLSGNAAFSTLETPPPLREHVPAAYGRQSFPPYGGLVPLWAGPAGDVYRYSNLGIATVGYIVEVTNPDGLSFSDFVQSRIVSPLDMRATQFPAVQDRKHVRPELFEAMSVGYARFGGLLVPTPTIYFADYPAGTVVTTPGSHLRLLLAYLGAGELNGQRILAPETVQEMLTPQLYPGDTEDTGQGLVWRLTNLGKPDASFGHSGAHMWGWTNHFEAFPELDVAVAVSMNRWDLPGDPGARYAEANSITEFIKAWVLSEQSGDPRAPSASSWAWKYSYAAGLMLTERILGTLGVAPPITETMIEDMAAGAREKQGAGGRARLWDADGFRAGVEDMSSVAMTPEAIAAFYRSSALQVAPEELRLIYAEMGGEAPR